MGDFNDDPINSSIKDHLKTLDKEENAVMKTLFNPMERMHSKGIGSVAWRDGWNLFDQIIISAELTENDFSSYRFYKAGVFNNSYLTQKEGRYNRYPFRFDIDSQDGYSDHFPVYIYLIKEKQE